MPAPRLFTTVPEASNFTSGAVLEPLQVVLAHRSNAQMLRPSRSTSIPAVPPSFRPSGILKWFGSSRYGFGYDSDCISAVGAASAVATTTAAVPSVTRSACDIAALQSENG